MPVVKVIVRATDRRNGRVGSNAQAQAGAGVGAGAGGRAVSTPCLLQDHGVGTGSVLSRDAGPERGTVRIVDGVELSHIHRVAGRIRGGRKTGRRRRRRERRAVQAQTSWTMGGRATV